VGKVNVKERVEERRRQEPAESGAGLTTCSKWNGAKAMNGSTRGITMKGCSEGVFDFTF
jgi:hypothetical protein